MDLYHPIDRALTRRTFLSRSMTGLGSLALASLLNGNIFARGANATVPGALPALHFAPRAKRVIFLFMFGGPSHIELFDPKPRLHELQGQELPPLVRGNQRF